MPEAALNVLGGELRACSFDPLTGYWRDGSCSEAPEDGGLHVVCATHERALDLVPLEVLKQHAWDASPSRESP